MGTRGSVHTSYISELVKKFLNPETIIVSPVQLEWRITAPKKFYDDVSSSSEESAEYKSFRKDIKAFLGPKEYPALWGSWSLELEFTVHQRSPKDPWLLSYWEAKVTHTPGGKHGPFNSYPGTVTVPAFHSAKVWVGKYPAHLVRIEKETGPRNHTQPWTYDFEMTNKPRRAFWTNNVVDMFGGDQIVATIDVPEVSPTQFSDVLFTEATRCLDRLAPDNAEISALRRTMEGLKLDTPLKTYEVIAGERSFSVEKTLLAKASPVLAQLFEGSSFLENETESYTFTDHSAEAVETFLVYCQTGKVEKERLARQYMELARLAHMYEVSSLVDLCEIAMISRAATCLPSAGSTIAEKMLQTGAQLSMHLFLSIVHLLQKEEYGSWSKNQRSTWHGHLAGNPRIGEEINRALQKFMA